MCVITFVMSTIFKLEIFTLLKTKQGPQVGLELEAIRKRVPPLKYCAYEYNRTLFYGFARLIEKVLYNSLHTGLNYFHPSNHNQRCTEESTSF